MECPRCNGLMMSQIYLQAMAEPDAWKCINCGNIICKKVSTIDFDSYSLFYHQEKIKNKK